MSDIFISYARSTAAQAHQVAEALREQGYSVWIDDDLPAHRTYSRVIEEQMTAAKAAVVIWSADAVQSEWVMSEANRAREDHKLVQVTTDTARLPMPFDTIQCADLAGWSGDIDAPGWRKVVASVADLIGGARAAALPAMEAPLALPSKPSIAVLPFANLSGDPEQEYFADGMVVEIAEALSRIRSIFVIASGSSLSLKGKGVSAQDAARQLGVRYVLEGSIRKAASRVRIGVQLIDAADDIQIWTNRFEDTLDDIFALQDRVALAVVGQIEPTVHEAEVRRASARPTENMGSYDLYLRAVPLTRFYSRVEVLQALDLLNRAIALDPHYGSALQLAASCHYLIVNYGWSAEPESNRRQGIEMAHRAIKASRDDAVVLGAAASALAFLERDMDAALVLVERAIALNPGSAIARLSSGLVRLRSGDPDLAVEHLEAAARLDPIGPDHPAYLAIMGMARLYQGRFAEAIALEREVIQQNDAPLCYAVLVASEGHLGNLAAALAALTRYRSLTQVPIEDFARGYSRDPAQLKLFLDGIALVEGERAPETDSAGPAP